MKRQIILAIGLISLLVLTGCIDEATSSTGNNIDRITQEAKIENGVQHIYLSWGKFNYNPEVMKVKANMPLVITADTKRLTGCFTSFEVPNLGIHETFSQQDNKIEFTPSRKGTFNFACAMGMGRGTLVVE